MSFFGYLAAGAADGIGKGLVGEADYAEKLRAQQLLMQEKQEGQMRLDAQRAQDRADRERENLLLRNEMKTQNRGSGNGGFSLFDLAERADTPEKQDRAISVVRAEAGDEAAERFAGIFGKGRTTRMADPAREDVTGYVDATGGMDTAVPAQVAVPGGQSAQEAEKGRLAIQAMLARVNGKYKDFAEGDARLLGTDAVRAAQEQGGDPAMRKAGAVNMALEGKDRVAVQGGMEVDQAGITAPKTTPVGDSMIRENNAQAGNAGASAAQHKAQIEKIKAEIENPKSKTASTERLFSQLNSVNSTLAGYKEDPRRSSQATPEAKKQYQEELAQAQALRSKLMSMMDGRLDPDAPTTATPKPAAPAAAKPAASTPLKITSQSQYNALRSGTRFIAPDGTTRIKP